MANNSKFYNQQSLKNFVNNNGGKWQLMSYTYKDGDKDARAFYLQVGDTRLFVSDDLHTEEAIKTTPLDVAEVDNQYGEGRVWLCFRRGGNSTTEASGNANDLVD